MFGPADMETPYLRTGVLAISKKLRGVFHRPPPSPSKISGNSRKQPEINGNTGFFGASTALSHPLHNLRTTHFVTFPPVQTLFPICVLSVFHQWLKHAI